MTKIGYQDGIASFIAWVRKQPGVQQRGPGYDKADLSTWPWPDKLERTLRILKDEHDAQEEDPPDPPPPPPPPPPSSTVAPRTYNTAPGGEPSARFCTTGLPRNANGRLFDSFSEYDNDGRDLGGRTDRQVPGLKPSNQMDGRGPCDPYGSFPPWPADSYAR